MEEGGKKKEKKIEQNKLMDTKVNYSLSYSYYLLHRFKTYKFMNILECDDIYVHINEERNKVKC